MTRNFCPCRQDRLRRVRIGGSGRPCSANTLRPSPVDPARLEGISGRLAELKQLRRKYGATLEDVLAFAEKAARASLARLDSLEEEIARMELKVEEISAEALLRAAELTQARRETAVRMAAAMERELVSLSFPQAVFQVRVSQPEGLGMEGSTVPAGTPWSFSFPPIQVNRRNRWPELSPAASCHG
jgi:hypothetical protein